MVKAFFQFVAIEVILDSFDVLFDALIDNKSSFREMRRFEIFNEAQNSKDILLFHFKNEQIDYPL